jgi:hypothetical protein
MKFDCLSSYTFLLIIIILCGETLFFRNYIILVLVVANEEQLSINEIICSLWIMIFLLQTVIRLLSSSIQLTIIIHDGHHL